jgi:PAS domain S-box-containing protein
MINKRLKQNDDEKNVNFFNIKNILLLFVVILLIVFSILYVRHSWLDSKEITSKNVIDIAHTIEISLNGDMLYQLQASPEDLKSDDYKVLKSKLLALKSVQKEARFIYFYKKINEKLFFLIDSEPSNSIDYSPPGQEYSEDDPEAYLPFKTGESIITKPTTDRWGTWVSVLVPIKNYETGEIYAVLGIDYPANKWQQEARQNAIRLSSILFIFILLIIVLYINIRRNDILIIANKERKIVDKQMAALTAVIEQSDDLIVVKDLNLKVVAANNTFVGVAGKTSITELIGKTDAEIFNLSQDIEPVKTYMSDEIHAQNMKMGEYIIREEELIKANGEKRIILTKKYPVFSNKNELLFTGSISHDITERKKAEAELKKSKELAEAASKAKTDFLSNMSHEIRTPLNGVIGFTELLRNTPLNNTQKEYLDNAIISANSLLSVISDILDFSKIEAGKLDLEIVKTDMILLMESTVDIIKVHAANKKLELLLNIQPGIPRFAMVDPIRLKQVLVNLMSNAVKFTQTGEVELKLSFEKKDDKKGLFTIAVRDTGIGIKATDKDKLFKAFSQADTSTTRRYGGTGLGLIISNSLTHKMGSKIEFDSEFGSGSTFYFTIETTYENGEIINTKNNKLIKKVLVIDDNYNNRMILEHTFKYWDIAYTGAESGQSGFDILNSGEQYDLIIVDYHMPVLDGIETIKKIKRECRFYEESQSIIMLHSSSDDIAIYEAAKELNIQFSLTKPIKSDDLYNYLQNIQTKVGDKTKTIENVPAKNIQFENSLKILIAEDNLMNMMVISKMLKNILPNVEIFEAENGIEVLEILDTIVPDLVLMDVQMPIMDGVDATKQIRKNIQHPAVRVPVIALTAGISKEERDNCYNAGMNYFLSKPIDNDLLHNMIIKYLNGSLMIEE